MGQAQSYPVSKFNGECRALKDGEKYKPPDIMAPIGASMSSSLIVLMVMYFTSLPEYKTFFLLILLASCIFSSVRKILYVQTATKGSPVECPTTNEYVGFGDYSTVLFYV